MLDKNFNFSKKVPPRDDKGEPCPYGTKQNCETLDCDDCEIYKDYQQRVAAVLAKRKA